MVKNGLHVAGKVVELYKKWRSLEGGSRSPDIAMKISFLEKQEQLRDQREDWLPWVMATSYGSQKHNRRKGMSGD